MSQQKRDGNGIKKRVEKPQKEDVSANAKKEPEKVEVVEKEQVSENNEVKSPAKKKKEEKREELTGEERTEGKTVEKQKGKKEKNQEKKIKKTSEEVGSDARDSLSSFYNKLPMEVLEEIKTEAQNDKSIKALIQIRKKMYNAYGEDSDEYRSADKKARDAWMAFLKRKIEERNIKPQDSKSGNAEPVEETTTSNNSVRKTTKKKPKSSVVKMAEGNEDKTEESSTTKTKTPKKNTKPVNYADFDSIDEKIGVIGKGIYQDKSIFDLIGEGYVVKPVTNKGKQDYLLGFPDDNSRYGVRMTQEQQPIILSDLFSKRAGGDSSDEKSFKTFVTTMKNKIKEYQNTL